MLLKSNIVNENFYRMPIRTHAPTHILNYVVNARVFSVYNYYTRRVYRS